MAEQLSAALLSTELPDSITLDELEEGQGSLRERALARWRQMVEKNASSMRSLREEAQELRRLVSPRGSALPPEVKEWYDQLHLPALNLNDVWPTIANITGREVIRKFQPIVKGRDVIADQGLADALNQILGSIRDGGDWDRHTSAAYRSAHLASMSAIEIQVDVKRKTPVFKASKVPLDELMVDLSAGDPNYEDGVAVARGRFVDLWQLKRKYPELAPKWAELKSQTDNDFDASNDVWAGTIGGAVEGDRFVPDGEVSYRWYNKGSDEAFVVDFQWYERDTAHLVRMPGEVSALWQQLVEDEMPFTAFDDVAPEELARLMPFLEGETPSILTAMGWLTAQAEQLIERAREAWQGQAAQAEAQGVEPPPPPPAAAIITREISPEQLLDFQLGYRIATFRPYGDILEVDRDTWYQAIIVGPMVLTVKELPHGAPTILPLVCYMEESSQGQVPYSTALLLRDRQLWKNAIANAIVYAAVTQTKASMQIDSSKLTQTSVDKLERDLVRSRPLIDVPEGALSALPGERNIPRGLEVLFGIINDSVPQAIGQSQATLGSLSSVSRTAFRLVEQQTTASEATVAEALDNLRGCLRSLIRLALRLVFTYWSPEDIAQAAGADYADHVQGLDRSRLFEALDFDLVVDQQPVTRHQALATLELLNQNAMWQALPEEALATLSGPAIGSTAQEIWLKEIRLREPQELLVRLDELLGYPEGTMAQLVERVQQQQQGQEAA